jgi:hypothetical protein
MGIFYKSYKTYKISKIAYKTGKKALRLPSLNTIASEGRSSARVNLSQVCWDCGYTRRDHADNANEDCPV